MKSKTIPIPKFKLGDIVSCRTRNFSGPIVGMGYRAYTGYWRYIIDTDGVYTKDEFNRDHINVSYVPSFNRKQFDYTSEYEFELINNFNLNSKNNDTEEDRGGLSFL